MNALVVGASGGIGLALVRELLAGGASAVFATHRGRCSTLEELAEGAGRLCLVPLEATCEDSIAAAAALVRERVSRLHLLVYAAGVLHGPDMQPERRLEHVDGEALALSFAVNATGPLLVAKRFHSLLAHAERAVFASISARVGSIGDNRLGGWYGYRASKAAQNMMTVTLSIELARRSRHVICVALHPGTVDTALSRPFQRNVPAGRLFDPRRAARALLSVIDSLTPADSGAFLDWRREPIPW